MSRIDSAEIAISKAKKAGFNLKGATMASDAFFPFRDSKRRHPRDDGTTTVLFSFCHEFYSIR